MGVFVGQNRFGGSSGTKEFEAEIRAGGEDSVHMAVIDTGPYLRQEGRPVARWRSTGNMRPAVSQIPAEHGRATPASTGFHAVRIRRFQQIHLQQGSGVAVWLSWLMQWVRQPG